MFRLLLASVFLATFAPLANAATVLATYDYTVSNIAPTPTNIPDNFSGFFTVEFDTSLTGNIRLPVVAMSGVTINSGHVFSPADTEVQIQAGSSFADLYFGGTANMGAQTAAGLTNDFYIAFGINWGSTDVSVQPLGFAPRYLSFNAVTPQTPVGGSDGSFDVTVTLRSVAPPPPPSLIPLPASGLLLAGALLIAAGWSRRRA